MSKEVWDWYNDLSKDEQLQAWAWGELWERQGREHATTAPETDKRLRRMEIVVAIFIVMLAVLSGAFLKLQIDILSVLTTINTILSNRP